MERNENDAGWLRQTALYLHMRVYVVRVVCVCIKHVGTCQRSIYSYRNLSWHLHAAVPPSYQRATLVVYCVTQNTFALR